MPRSGETSRDKPAVPWTAATRLCKTSPAFLSALHFFLPLFFFLHLPPFLLLCIMIFSLFGWAVGRVSRIRCGLADQISAAKDVLEKPRWDPLPLQRQLIVWALS